MRTYTPIVYKLSSTGKVMWRVGITVPPNFFTQDIVNLTDLHMFICVVTEKSI